ncbi:nuclease-related domain-containing protein [Streptomyces sp. NPDC050264]|uniref:nuclease-related domain-containing protein n=1 Tax=Streptomyces sp. NPDC050264 TaxID=3155038 RepID=UPI00343BE8F2
MGEQVTGRKLDRLKRHGWFILHAVQWASGADIDHLIIGPAGVFTINSKRHKRKTVWYGDRAITVNGSSTQHIGISQAEARRVARVLSQACRFPVPVRPAISVVHAAKVTVKGAAPPVLVLPAEDLGRVLTGLSPVLPPGQAARIYEVARDPRTWA